MTRDQAGTATENEVIRVYPHRWVVPSDLWRDIFDSAELEIDILVYSGLFLAEDAGIQRILRRKANAGVKVRFLLGDPAAEPVAQRGADEGIDDAMSVRIRNALVLHRPLRDVDGIQFRLHRTVLYNSIYRADDQVLVNTHIYSFPASQAPVLHLRRLADADMASTYLESFERVWDTASAIEWG